MTVKLKGLQQSSQIASVGERRCRGSASRPSAALRRLSLIPMLSVEVCVGARRSSSGFGAPCVGARRSLSGPTPKTSFSRYRRFVMGLALTVCLLRPCVSGPRSLCRGPVFVCRDRRSLCRGPALSGRRRGLAVHSQDSFSRYRRSVLGLALSVEAQRSVCRGPTLFVSGSALFVSGPGALCVGLVSRRAFCWGPALCRDRRFLCRGPARQPGAFSECRGPALLASGRSPAVCVSGHGAFSSGLVCVGARRSVSGPGALCQGTGALGIGPGALCLGPGALSIGLRRSLSGCVWSPDCVCIGVGALRYVSGTGASWSGPARFLSVGARRSLCGPGAPCIWKVPPVCSAGWVPAPIRVPHPAPRAPSSDPHFRKVLQKSLR